MVIDAELHADQEKVLLENDSRQENLWGINLYPDDFQDEDFIEFDSMINLRPSWGNRSRGVDDENIHDEMIGDGTRDNVLSIHKKSVKYMDPNKDGGKDVRGGRRR